MTNHDKFWKSLSTSTRNKLLRQNSLAQDPISAQPWEYTIKELIRIPGIGPAAIAEIATLTEKYCV